MITLFFWVSLFVLLYTYFGYPLLSSILSRTLNRGLYKSDATPSVTVLIAAYNEHKHIRQTIENKLSLDYPEELLEIIVVSDGSTDGTDEIVREYEDKKVRLIRQEPRAGKTSALNLAMGETNGEIIIFSDSNSIYSPDAIRRLVSNFSDYTVGYVTGKMIYTDDAGTPVGDGCSAYMKYENKLREIETNIGSVVGVDGGVDAVRKRLYVEMRADQLPDFILPLKVVEQGYRVVYEPDAMLNESSLTKSGEEYRMRVRVSLRAMNALRDMRHLLNPLKYGLFSWQLMSHKILRYAVFIFLLLIYAANILLLEESTFYKITFLLQNLFYIAAGVGFIFEKIKIHTTVFYIPFYFTLLNLASAHAFIRFLKSEKQVTWEPRKG